MTVVSLIPSLLMIGLNLVQNVCFLALRVYMIPTFVIDPDNGVATSLRVTALVSNLNLAVESLKVRVEVTLTTLRFVH